MNLICSCATLTLILSLHEGRLPSVTTFIHFCARLCSETRVSRFFNARRCSEKRILISLDERSRSSGSTMQNCGETQFFIHLGEFGGFGGSIAPNCGEMRILSSKNCPAQSTRRFNAQHMEHGTMNVAVTLCFRSRSYIVSRIFKVAPVLDVSVVIQCGISVVLQFSSQQLCFASARWLRAVYWTFQV